MKLVHWPLMDRLLHLVQQGGPGRDRSPPRPLLAVLNVIGNSNAFTITGPDGPDLSGFSINFRFFLIFFLFVQCGGQSWLHVSFFTARNTQYRIVLYSPPINGLCTNHRIAV